MSVGLIFLLCILATFVIIELNNCFFNSKNIIFLIFYIFIFVLLQLIPTIPFIINIYFWKSEMYYYIFLLTYFLCSIFISFLSIFFLKKIKEKNMKFLATFFLAIFITNSLTFIVIYVSTIYFFTTLMILVALASLNDSMAFFCGTRFGKHKMSPKISPNKTWEGAILGTIISILILIVVLTLMEFGEEKYNTLSNFIGKQINICLTDQFSLTIWWITAIVIIAILCIVSIIGDLFFSICKRQSGIKDFSNIFPGHGGLLDRLDSISFVIISYALFSIFISSSFSIINNIPLIPT
ncbi:MAG: phosphatidate cytidylyltransferase [Mycoplasmataceae bacterium]|nr:phosphatidate cytidylyltransferase [Mycoplasmataceae bacterium]